MRRKLVSISLMVIDALIIALVSYLALYIRFEGHPDPTYIALLDRYIPLVILIRLTIFYLFGLYNRLWRYASIGEMLGVTAAVSSGSVVIFFTSLSMGMAFPKSFYIISWFLNIILIGVSRLGLRIASQVRLIPKNGRSRVLIVGAGDAGAMIGRELGQQQSRCKRIVGFVDDALFKQGQRLLGYKVLGNHTELPRLVTQYQVDEIVVAIPSLAGEALRRLIEDCRQTGCRVKIVPKLEDLTNGKPTLDQLREVNLEDLLQRKPIKLELDKLTRYLQGKRILVTGAGGSIGSELCRQIVQFKPQSLIMLGRGENSIYEIEHELRAKYPDLHIEPVIADVRDSRRIRSVFARTKPEVVFHAAAHKHVPLMELQPEEAVQNNIFGTQNVAEAADAVGTEVFVMISTDKAVNPTSVMGATKRVAEQVIQRFNMASDTRFAAVRFGNVLGSRGSVVPLFKKQIAAGGPVTVTDPEMTRYFMTIPEAVQLVLQAGAMAEGGEVFVLDMGEPVRIFDMACTLIELSGLEPQNDIEIVFTGLRPGEKLYEELLTAEEGTTATKNAMIHKANLQEVDVRKLQQGLLALERTSDDAEIRKLIKSLVPAFSGSKTSQTCGIVEEKTGSSIGTLGELGIPEARQGELVGAALEGGQ